MNNTYDSHTTKSFIGIKYKRTSDYISDNREKYKHSQLYGESGVTLDSQGRLRVQGIDIQTIGPVYLKGVKGVEILPGNEVSSRYEIHTSKNFKIGSDKVLKIEQNKNTKEIDTIKSIGSIINSKGSMVTIEGDKVVSIGSKIGAAGDIKLIGKNGVVIKDGENFAKIREETEKMRAGMFTSLSLKNLSAGIGVEATYNKTNEGKTIVTPEKNTFVTNKNIYITSSEGNVLLQGDFGAKENIGITAEKGKIYIKDSKSEILTDSKSVNARVALTLGTSLSGLKDTLKSSFNVVKNSKELLKMPKIAKKLLSGKDLNEALAGNEGAIEEANLIANGPKSGNAETGLYLSGSLTNTKQSTKIINSIGSNLIAKNNITLKSGDDINLTMVNIISKNIFINAGKNINIYAGKSTMESRESTKSLSGSYNLLTDQFSIGAGVTKDISVNKISVQFVKRTPKWGLAAIQDILGGYVKNTVLVPVDYTINKFKLYEKYDIFKSGNTTYKVTIEKDEKGNIHKNKKEVSKKEKFAKGTYAFVNGMYTPLDIAVNIYLPQFELMKDDFRNDEELENLKPGEKREYVLFYNEYHTFEGDLIECLYDKFGTKGDGKKIYSNAAKQLGEKLYINRDRIEDMKLFSQGNIQWYSGMQSMEETYGEGVLNKVITSHYTSIGSPLNGDDFRKFIAAKVGNGKAKVKIKNDEREPVANFIGWNPGNVKRGTFLTNRIKNGEDKLIDIEFHSYYFLEQENTTDERYRLYQKPVNVYGKLLELYNIDTYINFFNKYKEERGKKNEKK